MVINDDEEDLDSLAGGLLPIQPDLCRVAFQLLNTPT